MEAPDKIYIRPMPNPSDGYVGIAWDKTIPMCETYIRKGALLEWANARKAGLSSGESFVAGERKMLKEIIDKLNSM